MKKPIKDYIIAGIRQNNEAVYWLKGQNWCPNAQSIAQGYESKEKAEAVAESLKPRFLGLKISVYPRLKNW